MHEASADGTRRLLRRWTAASSLLVGSDYDGTLSEIAPNADLARPALGAREVIERLARAPGVAVAIVSGRTMESLQAQLGSMPGIWYIAEHGARIQAPGGVAFAEPDTHPDPAVVAALGADAERIAERWPGVRVERKSTSVAIHVRDVPEAERPAALATLSSWRAASIAAGFAVIDGRQVVEARGSRRAKAGALETIARSMPSFTELVYAGDDTTDIDALAFVHARGGAALYVASTERPHPGCSVDATLGGPADWVRLLEQLADARLAA
jgi:trehalose-phosphatase